MYVYVLSSTLHNTLAELHGLLWERKKTGCVNTGQQCVGRRFERTARYFYTSVAYPSREIHGVFLFLYAQTPWVYATNPLRLEYDWYFVRFLRGDLKKRRCLRVVPEIDTNPINGRTVARYGVRLDFLSKKKKNTSTRLVFRSKYIRRLFDVYCVRYDSKPEALPLLHVFF